MSNSKNNSRANTKVYAGHYCKAPTISIAPYYNCSAFYNYISVAIWY